MSRKLFRFPKGIRFIENNINIEAICHYVISSSSTLGSDRHAFFH